MINELLAPGPLIDPFKYHGCVGIVVIMVFDLNANSLIPREVGAVERIGREWAIV